MDYNDTYEREIDIKELMFAILYKWRLILAFAVAVAALLGGYKAVSLYADQNDAETSGAARDSYAKELESYNHNIESYEREIDNLTQSVASQQKYLENSVLMNMSPYDIWEAKAEIFIKADAAAGNPDEKLTVTIMRAYQSVLTSGEFLSGIAQKIGIDERYIQELVNVILSRDSSRGDENLFKVEGGTSGVNIRSILQDSQDCLLTIQVRHGDEDTARELLENVLEGINQFQAPIQSAVAPHTVREVSNSVGSRVDLTLADKQYSERSRLKVLQETLQARTDEMGRLKAPKSALSPMAYGGIGGVLGGFMAAFFVCIGFVMSDKVYSAKELKYRFKVKILGVLPVEMKKASKIDRWLERLEGRAHDVDEAHEWDLISANACNYMESLKSLLVVGSAQEEKISQIATELSARLTGVNVMLGGNILHNAEGLRKLPECEGIVLVEQCGKSLYRDVELEIERACDLQKAVVGCVVLGGG